MKLKTRDDILTFGMLVLLLFFNFVDALATVFLIQKYDARELNPLMDLLIQFSPLLFIWVKNSYAVLVGFLTWDNRARPAVVPVASAVTLAYAINFGYQIALLVLALS